MFSEKRTIDRQGDGHENGSKRGNKRKKENVLDRYSSYLKLPENLLFRSDSKNFEDELPENQEEEV